MLAALMIQKPNAYGKECSHLYLKETYLWEKNSIINLNLSFKNMYNEYSNACNS